MNDSVARVVTNASRRHHIPLLANATLVDDVLVKDLPVDDLQGKNLKQNLARKLSAGPSSAGKSFARRSFALFLKSNGMILVWSAIFQQKGT